MEQQEASTVQSTEIRPPERRERLSDEKMGNLLAAFGNNEAKALTLVLMNQGVIYMRGDIHRTIIHAQGKNPAWKMQNRGPFGYCSESLAPIGLVAREITDTVLGTYGYEKTEYGRETGDPWAALLLNFSLNHTLSLYQVFASTVSGSKDHELEEREGKIEFRKRAPTNRLKILRELIRADLSIKLADLARKVAEDRRVVLKHLESLGQLGVITFEPIEMDEPSVFYKLSNKFEGEPDVYKGYRTRTKKIRDLLNSEPDKLWTIQDILEKYSEPEIKKDFLRTQVVGILAHLHKQGYLEKGKIKPKNEISISDVIRVQLLDLIELINAFQNQDPEVLEKGRELARKLRSGNMEREIAQLMQKAKENSPFANQEPSEKTEEIVLSIILQNQNIKASEIKKILAKEYSRKLASDQVRNMINHLKSQGLIVGEKGKAQSIRWTVNPQAQKDSRVSEVRSKMGLS